MRENIVYGDTILSSYNSRGMKYRDTCSIVSTYNNMIHDIHSDTIDSRVHAYTHRYKHTDIMHTTASHCNPSRSHRPSHNTIHSSHDVHTSNKMFIHIIMRYTRSDHRTLSYDTTPTADRKPSTIKKKVTHDTSANNILQDISLQDTNRQTSIDTSKVNLAPNISLTMKKPLSRSLNQTKLQFGLTSSSQLKTSMENMLGPHDNQTTQRLTRKRNYRIKSGRHLQPLNQPFNEYYKVASHKEEGIDREKVEKEMFEMAMKMLRRAMSVEEMVAIEPEELERIAMKNAKCRLSLLQRPDDSRPSAEV